MKKHKFFRKLMIGTFFLAAFAAAVGLMALRHRRRPASVESPVPDYVFTYAENQAEDYPTTQGAFRFAELVKERTNGRIQIQIRSSGELGTESSVIEQLRFGGIDFARVSLVQLTGLVPEMSVLYFPFLYEDSAHMWRVLDGEIGERFLGSFAGTGLTALSWYDAGARNFYSTDKQIRSLEDMKGLVIRVQETAFMEDTIQALGGKSVQLPYNEVYSELQKKSIDGAENNWPSYESERHYEMAPYYTVDEHMRIPELQIVSQVTWDKLPAEDQAVIRQCAQESALYERELWTAREKESEERVRAAGCKVYVLPDEERERFRARMLPVYRKYGRDQMDVVAAIRALAE